MSDHKRNQQHCLCFKRFAQNVLRALIAVVLLLKMALNLTFFIVEILMK